MIRILTLFSILIVSLSLAMASQIKVMTYNINLLPNIPISDMTSNLNHPYKRAYYIPKKIAKKNIDVVAFQEAIAPLSFYILDKRMKAFGYKYRTKLVGVPSLTHLNLLNGGVLIYSRYPIIGQSQYMVFPRSYGLEGFQIKVWYIQRLKRRDTVIILFHCICKVLVIKLSQASLMFGSGSWAHCKHLSLI